jgi:predicted RNA-binding protein
MGRRYFRIKIRKQKIFAVSIAFTKGINQTSLAITNHKKAV